MYRKILAMLVCSLLVLLVGCKSDEKVVSSTDAPVKTPEPVYYLNNLTGEQNLTDKDATDNRPVAVMINNISIAQKVQTGLTQADIVYETEVEGGITRLLAVFKDISKVKKFGTVRSARYDYIDLALGHDAVYIHHGQDPTYAAPHLKDIQSFVLGTNNAGVREKNGLASEHTLYGYGDKLWDCLEKQKYNLTSQKNENWQDFADKDTEITYTNLANSVKIKFSTGYTSVFKYDSESGKYIRFFKDTERKDYVTGESEYFKNIFVLATNIYPYPDNVHKKFELDSGTGYYCVNGTYTPIKWEKGNSKDSLKFFNEDGTPLKVNQGNSWVNIHSKNFAPVFE